MALHCVAVGSPVPEIQWWFEGNDPNDSCSQLWDGARLDRVHIHATYRQHAASSLSIDALTTEDTGIYECRASSDPDRNHLTRPPRVKWVRAQASVVVLEREWPGHLSLFTSCATRPWLPLCRTRCCSALLYHTFRLTWGYGWAGHSSVSPCWVQAGPALFQVLPQLVPQAFGLLYSP